MPDQPFSPYDLIQAAPPPLAAPQAVTEPLPAQRGEMFEAVTTYAPPALRPDIWTLRQQIIRLSDAELKAFTADIDTGDTEGLVLVPAPASPVPLAMCLRRVAFIFTKFAGYTNVNPATGSAFMYAFVGGVSSLFSGYLVNDNANGGVHSFSDLFGTTPPSGVFCATVPGQYIDGVIGQQGGYGLIGLFWDGRAAANADLLLTIYNADGPFTGGDPRNVLQIMVEYEYFPILDPLPPLPTAAMSEQLAALAERLPEALRARLLARAASGRPLKVTHPHSIIIGKRESIIVKE